MLLSFRVDHISTRTAAPTLKIKGQKYNYLAVATASDDIKLLNLIAQLERLAVDEARIAKGESSQ